MLVIFADEERDERLDEQRRALGPGAKDLHDRDVRVVEVVGPDPLRDALEVPARGFHVVLVNNQNAIQLKRDGVVSLDSITEAMPTTLPTKQ